MNDDASQLDDVVRGDGFVLWVGIEIWVLSWADPDVRIVLPGKEDLGELQQGSGQESPEVNKGWTELVVEPGRILQPEDEDVPGNGDEVQQQQPMDGEVQL